MLCQDCKKREAQVHLTQIVNNEKTSLNLCKQCAAARGFHSPLDDMPFPLAEILTGLASTTPGVRPQDDLADDLTCPGCGLTFRVFTGQGRFGCGQCYKAFRTRLEPIMRKIHGASLHRGHMPVVPLDAGDTETIPVKEEERLEAELAKAIDNEDFERAAELRDKLKTIREEEPAEQQH